MSQNILIIDDSVELLEAFQYFLEGAGYKIKSLDSATDVILNILDFKPEVIILDVVLKRIDGREICKLIKNNPETRHIPIILMSANPTALLDFEECMADEILEKPFNIKDVLEKVKLVLRD